MPSELTTEGLLTIIRELKRDDKKSSKWYVAPLVTIIIAAVGYLFPGA